MDNLRQPPHSVEAEQNVLGAVMFAPQAWDDIADTLTAADFYRRDHRVIFTAMGRLALAHAPVDAVTLAAELERAGELAEAGGLTYLGELVKSAVSGSNAMHYARIVRERSQLRQLLRVSFEVGDAAYDLQPAEAIIDRTSGALLDIAAGVGATDDKTGIEAARQWLGRLDEIFRAGTSITGYRTGFPDLDRAIRGLNRKHLTLVAARPSMGKTTLMTNIIRHVLHGGASAYLATMEMAADDVMNQLCAAHTGCLYEDLQDARMGDEGVQAATAAFAMALKTWRLTINDSGTQTVASIGRGVRKHIRKHGRDAVLFVDYAQLVADRNDNETIRIGEISRGMKILAQDLDIPVVLLSQLSRDCEKRADKRPMLSDLRGSGSLEQDASEVLFLYDDSVYNPATMAAGFTELIVAKNRHGKRGMVLPLLKQLDRARFLSPDYRDMPENWRGIQTAPKRAAL